ncbi:MULTISPECIES: GNAT family N-acetyltransferase [Flavobacteriaceae]|uniref:GNAT family N-acetyltransferase n=1 Tax=Flavobacteriaceae TaxID=49546 RepID=UPI00234921B6|nr:GNAT family N-acetyltransferase [Muricauda sp. SP22]MDC6363818.1 GNAT family N-acetyltransferase [Muricauda sp. SP22]
MNISFRPCSVSDFATVTDLIIKLYNEDPGLIQMTKEKALGTLELLSKKADLGSVLVIEVKGETIGYCMLINYWSNEYGGNILHIDELFIKEEYRSKGIGSQLIYRLAKSKFADAVGLQLEVTPDNARAKKLYEKLGFTLRKNSAYEMGLD